MRGLRFAFRTLLKTPVVTLVAIVSLALGIGANSATFSVLYQILLQPLPVQEPERLVNLSAPGPIPGMQSCSRAGECDVVWSYPLFQDLEEGVSGFSGIAAHRSFGANLAFRGETSSGEGLLVSGSYFPTLGLRPALGRLLAPEDDRTVGGDFVVVLSHAYWRNRFDGSHGVLGEVLIVNGQPMTIVGVAPAGFQGTVLGERPEVFVPLTMHLGIDVEGITVFTLSPELNNYNPDESRALFERVEGEISAIPGVSGVTAALVPLLSGSNWGDDVAVEGFESGPDVDANSRFNEVGPDYFRTMRVPLIAGREFTRADALSAPKVAMVNEAFARKFGIEEGPVGRRMAADEEKGLDIEIVGLVPDTKYSEVKQDPPPLFFLPYRQDERLGFLTFYVRGELPPEQLMPAIRSAVKRLDPNLPLENLKTMGEQVRENVFMDRMISTLSGAFAALATILAAVGLYGVLAYSVARRTREMGLRMALGADGGRVRRMVLGQVAWMAVTGGVIGIAAALGFGRLARALLFEVEGHDPLVILAAAVLLGTMALAAGLIPALTASRIDPMRALRYE